MTIREMYEKVNLVRPLEQRRFFNYYEDSVNELLMMYEDFVFLDDAEYVTPKTLDSNNVVRPLYHNAIIDNILFLASAGGENNQMYKTEFIRKSRAAFHRYWSENAKGKRIKRPRW